MHETFCSRAGGSRVIKFFSLKLVNLSGAEGGGRYKALNAGETWKRAQREGKSRGEIKKWKLTLTRAGVARRGSSVDR